MRPSLLLVALGLAMSVAACEKREVPPLLPQIGKDGKAAIQPEASQDAVKKSQDQSAPR
jgi:hypothetical protein